jgi:hypothetical protein
MASLVICAGVIALALASGLTIAIVPGLTYAVAATAIYSIYQTESQRAAEPRAEAAVIARGLADVAIPSSFRVVGARGVCPLGREVGDVLTVDAAGSVTPQVCPHAEAALRAASLEAGEPGITDWCCPVYDHLLVFRPEALAA